MLVAIALWVSRGGVLSGAANAASSRSWACVGTRRSLTERIFMYLVFSLGAALGGFSLLTSDRAIWDSSVPQRAGSAVVVAREPAVGPEGDVSVPPNAKQARRE